MTPRTPGRGPTPPLDGLLAGLRLALGAPNAPAHRAALLEVADWPGLESLAAYHRVSGLFLRGTANAGVRLPDRAVAGALTRRRGRDALRGLRQLDAMKRVTAALDAAGIRSLVLKGLPLGQRAYGDPFVKSAIDVDLLVPEDAFPAAADVLRTLGWRRVPDFRETPARRKWCDSVEHDEAFEGGGAKIELHRRLLRNPFLFHRPFDRLDAAAATVTIGTHRFRTLGDADHLLYVACHGAKHFWFRLKWLCDFAALAGAMDGKTVAGALAAGRREGLETVLAATLRLCREDLQVEAPRAAAGARRPGPRERFVVALSRRAWTPRAGLRQLAWRTVLRPGRVILGTGPRYLRHEARTLLFGHHDFAALDLPDRLFGLYALVRPVRMAERLLRGRL